MTHTEEISAARKSLRKCKHCEWLPTFNYEPGVTFYKCPCGKIASLPDWEPEKTAEKWNMMHGVRK